MFERNTLYKYSISWFSGVKMVSIKAISGLARASKSVGLTKLAKSNIKKEVISFCKSNKVDGKRFNNAMYSFSHLGSYTSAAMHYLGLINFPQAPVAVVAGTAAREVCIGLHKVALSGAKKLAGELKLKGFNQLEREYAVKKYLRKEGNPYFTNLFLLKDSNKVKKIADAQEVNSGFVSTGLLDNKVVNSFKA